MDDRRDAWLGCGRRLLCGAPVAAIGWWLLAAPPGCAAADERRILGLFCVVAACIIVAPGFAAVAAEPTGGLFYPRHRSPPQPGYSLAEAQRHRRWFAAAIEEYDRIAEQFPADLHTYAAMMEIAALDLRDGAHADAIAKRGLAALPDEASRLELVRLHRALRNRLRDLPPARPSAATDDGAPRKESDEPSG